MMVCLRELEGLGADVATLERLCHEDAEALVLLREATVGPVHIHRDSDIVTITDAERGNAKPYTLTRLADKHPALYERVKAGEVSAHAAAIEARFRKPTLTLPADVPALARALRPAGAFWT